MSVHASQTESTRFRDTSQQIHKQWQTDPTRAFPSVGNAVIDSSSVIYRDVSSTPNSTPSPSSSPINDSRVTYNENYDHGKTQIYYNSKARQKQMALYEPTASPRTPGVGADATTITKTGNGGRISEVMELCYVTERIIALWYREDAQGVLEHATNLLQGKHTNNFMIFNLSSPRKICESNTRECGWPQGLAPSLERLCALCKELDSWLNAAPNRVVVLHSRGTKERLGVAVSAYMNYSSICGSRDQALDRFAMRRFLDDKIGPLTVPSHRRYIEYFSGLLAGSLRISPSPLYLTHITVLGVPLFEPTGCRAFLKVYEGLTPVYTSDLYSVTNAREFTVNLGGLRLRGDILIKCYHRIYSKQSREVMFSLQFHTCVITENVVSFPRSELDVACNDTRCPSDSVVTLYFGTDARLRDGPIPAPTPAVPHASAHHDPILHWDSYINLDNSDDEGRDTPLSPPPLSNSSVQVSPRGVGYTCGPIDGSLYAIVHQNAGGTARGSPLTVSMDSGISSAPPQRPSPPENPLATESSENETHEDLDKLLHDMMMTVESMPDPPSLDDYNRTDKTYITDGPNYGNSNPTSTYSTLKDSSYRSYSSTRDSNQPYASSSNYGTLLHETTSNYDDSGKKSFSPGGNIEFIDEDIPYHARQTSQPFSYGATTDMIKHQKLSSPSLVRKATMRDAAPIVDLDNVLGNCSNRAISPCSPDPPDPPPEFANGHIKFSANTADGLSWLKQQQLKLAARKDEHSVGKLWHQETGHRVIGELRNLQKGRPRQDGYASDSAVLDDDDDLWTPHTSQQIVRAPHTSAPASPLLPQRSSSRKYNGSAINTINGRPRAESVNERSFVSVKRAYGPKKNTDGQLALQSPQSSSHTDAATLLETVFQQSEINNAEKQPPRPESRSDSYAKAETIMKEYRQSNGLPLFFANTLHQENCKTVTQRNNIQQTLQNRVSYSNINHSNLNNNKNMKIYDNNDTTDTDQHVKSLSKMSIIGSISPSINNNENHRHKMNYDTSTVLSNTWLNNSNGDFINTDTNSPLTQSPKAWQFSVQAHGDSATLWAERSISPAGVGIASASRPQTPAFPVYPRTPYVNNSSPTVTFASDLNCMTSNNMNDTSNYSVHNNNIQDLDGIGYNNNINKRYGVDRCIYTEERRDISRETGLPPKSPTTQRKERPISPSNDSMIMDMKRRNPEILTHVEYSQSPKVQFYNLRRSSVHSNSEPEEVADVNVKFVRDTSKIWYKPNISREQAIAMLRDAAPGTFVVRDSNSFPGAFGLALKVATPPPGAPSSPKDSSCELVRHFLIEPTSRGVRLKGCANEPVFSSLSALVYQHSLMAMALPCQLLLPESEAAARILDSPSTGTTQQLLAQGAACNVLYLFTMDTESLTGPHAINKAITLLFNQKPLATATIVHFKVSTQGITLTDNARKLFFRRHYPTNNISYCGVDTEDRTWNFNSNENGKPLSLHRCFGFVARKPAHKSDNQCHIFAELEPGQPATAIVNFVNKVMMGSSPAKVNIV